MLKNCDNQFRFGHFRKIKRTATNNHHVDQTKNEPQEVLVNTGGATRRVARTFIRAGKTTTEFQHLNNIYAPSLWKIGHETCMFLAFSPEQLCSDLSRQIKSLLSVNWQVLKVLIVKFQASTLDQFHHLLINKSASKSLNATSVRSAVCFLQPILQLSK